MRRCSEVQRAAVFAALLFCVPAAALGLAPERIVRNTTVSSQHDPPLHIAVPEEAVYAGADHWILYDTADAELHLFVDADAEKKIRRFWWIQFEEILPAKPDSRYTYDGPVMDVDGLAFFVRARFGRSGDRGRAGSDTEHVQDLLARSGYTAPAEMMNVRFVHLPDALKRKELMIIYAEALPEGLTSAQLMKDGKASEAWAPIEKDLIERARKSITLTQMN